MYSSDTWVVPAKRFEHGIPNFIVQYIRIGEFCVVIVPREKVLVMTQISPTKCHRLRCNRGSPVKKSGFVKPLGDGMALRNSNCANSLSERGVRQAKTTCLSNDDAGANSELTAQLSPPGAGAEEVSTDETATACAVLCFRRQV